MDCPGLSPQRCFHPASVLSCYFGCGSETGAPFRQGIARAPGGGGKRCNGRFNGGGKTCRISGKGIYRALGVENIRHRTKG